MFNLMSQSFTLFISSLRSPAQNAANALGRSGIMKVKSVSVRPETLKAPLPRNLRLPKSPYPVSSNQEDFDGLYLVYDHASILTKKAIATLISGHELTEEDTLTPNETH